MVLVQFVITLDDITNGATVSNSGYTITAINPASASYNNPAVVNRYLNLHAGRYLAFVDGMTLVSGAVNTTTTQHNPQLITLDSSRWSFPGGNTGLSFPNSSEHNMSDVKGRRPFEIEFGGGNMDISVEITQFGQNINVGPAAVISPWTIDKTATWSSARFAYILLSLDLVPKDSKLPFGLM